MRFHYSRTAPSQRESDSLPRIPLTLSQGDRTVEVVGLVDSGSTANVLPYEVGLQLGEIWDDRKANIRLTGTLGDHNAMPVLLTADIQELPSVMLAFAWVKTSRVPLILGEMNFFMEFDVHFYRSRFEFEIVRKSSV